MSGAPSARAKYGTRGRAIASTIPILKRRKKVAELSRRTAGGKGYAPKTKSECDEDKEPPGEPASTKPSLVPVPLFQFLPTNLCPCLPLGGLCHISQLGTLPLWSQRWNGHHLNPGRRWNVLGLRRGVIEFLIPK